MKGYVVAKGDKCNAVIYETRDAVTASADANDTDTRFDPTGVSEPF